MVQQYLCSLEHFNSWTFDQVLPQNKEGVPPHYKAKGTVPVGYELGGKYVWIAGTYGLKPPLYVDIYVNGARVIHLVLTPTGLSREVAIPTFKAQANDIVEVDASAANMMVVVQATIPDNYIVAQRAFRVGSFLHELEGIVDIDGDDECVEARLGRLLDGLEGKRIHITVEEME